MANLKSKIDSLPNTPGIYMFYDQNSKLLYVGKSVSIRKRVASYFAKQDLGPKTNLLVKKISHVKTIKVFSEYEALLLEANLIKKYQPFFNSQAKDDKSPLYIKIGAGKIPLVTTTRKEQTQKGIFSVGPFPSSKVARDILRITRKIFPYCHHKNPKKPCLFVHLGLCPYPYGAGDAQTNYPSSIKKIKKLLSGQSKLLINQQTKTMTKLAHQQRYEEADIAKKQIQKLQFLTKTYHPPQDFLEQPTLVDDLTANKLKDLTQVLELAKTPRRIECYDISNIQGAQATGSMVVFTNGQADKSQYRRFRIKFIQKPDDYTSPTRHSDPPVGGEESGSFGLHPQDDKGREKPNDYEMLREVLERRLANDWPKPDLIIIDGGRGQLNVALSAIKKFKANTPAISLAKRFEQIYLPGKVLPLSLSVDSPTRQLVQSIRDEAHRFAITYHRLLRSKQQLK